MNKSTKLLKKFLEDFPVVGIVFVESINLVNIKESITELRKELTENENNKLTIKYRLISNCNNLAEMFIVHSRLYWNYEKLNYSDFKNNYKVVYENRLICN